MGPTLVSCRPLNHTNHQYKTYLMPYSDSQLPKISLHSATSTLASVLPCQTCLHNDWLVTPTVKIRPRTLQQQSSRSEQRAYTTADSLLWIKSLQTTGCLLWSRSLQQQAACSDQGACDYSLREDKTAWDSDGVWATRSHEVSPGQCPSALLCHLLLGSQQKPTQVSAFSDRALSLITDLVCVEPTLLHGGEGCYLLCLNQGFKVPCLYQGPYTVSIYYFWVLITLMVLISSDNSEHELVAPESEVRRSVSSLNPSKAADPDHLSPKLLKNICSSQLSYILTFIFSYSLMTRSIPKLWKKSCIIPVSKKLAISQYERFEACIYYKK